MSHARKHVISQALDSFPTPEEGQVITRVISIRGSNILEVEYPSGERQLCLMPAKFNKTIWVKRGNYVIVEPFIEQFKTLEAKASKLKARIVTILLRDQVKHLQKTGLWPAEFIDASNGSTEVEALQAADDSDERKGERDSDEEEEELDEYLINPNHRVVEDSDSDSEEDSSTEHEDGEKERDPSSKRY